MKSMRMIVSAVLALLVLSGCGPKTGRPLSDAQAQALSPGKTTKDEMFAMFGAPTAILGRGEVAVVNAPFKYKQYTYSFSSDTLFELFPAVDRLEEHCRIYYYRHAVSEKVLLPLLLWFQVNGRTRTDQLWVLMNERTGAIDDYAFKKHGENVVFGRPREEDPMQTRRSMP